MATRHSTPVHIRRLSKSQRPFCKNGRPFHMQWQHLDHRPLISIERENEPEIEIDVSASFLAHLRFVCVVVVLRIQSIPRNVRHTTGMVTTERFHGRRPPVHTFSEAPGRSIFSPRARRCTASDVPCWSHLICIFSTGCPAVAFAEKSDLATTRELERVLASTRTWRVHHYVQAH